MITSVDTSVLLDVLGASAGFGPRSAAALRQSLAEGTVVACEAVWAETAALFPSGDDAEAAMDSLRIEYSPLTARAAAHAGQTWREHRKAGGGRRRVVTDFLVAAHAVHQADRLLTRDRGFYRHYFEDLVVLDPSARS